MPCATNTGTMGMRILALIRSCTILAFVTMNGCSVTHLVQEEGYKSDVEKMNVQLQAAHQQCKDNMQSPDLDLIRQKVELNRTIGDKDPPSFLVASNEAFPIDPERQVIAKWAAMRDACVRAVNAIQVTPSSANAKERIDFQEQMSITREATAHIGELVLALYQQKLTYGEFAQKQYEFCRDAQAAEYTFTRAVIERDDDQRMQDEQQAKQQYAKVVTGWTDYIQEVNARQPQTAKAHAAQ